MINKRCAGVAQLAEQLICNQQVVGSSPITSSTFLFSGKAAARQRQGGGRTAAGQQQDSGKAD